MIDLRSDTVTLPSDAMRQAMAEASVGDDVYGEDPTANALEARAAQVLGKQAALFVPSGTMGNLIALLTHCGRGEAAIVGDEAHIYHYEAGGASALGGVVMKVVPTLVMGELPIEALQRCVSARDDFHQAPSQVVCLENTHGRRGGTCLPEPYMRDVRAWASAHGLRIHLDGARLFNAAVAQKCDPATLAAVADTVQCCLSKGLGAPAGCVLAGDSDFVRRARRWRKMLGGGMRQVGVLAAPGLLALERGAARLAEDHANAQYLAARLAALPGVTLAMDPPPTNIVLFTLPGKSVAQMLAALQSLGVRATQLGAWARFVTHANISRADCAAAADRVAQLCAGD